jgi:hypothetical protein
MNEREEGGVPELEAQRINIDAEMGVMTTPIKRHPEPEQDFEADCPVHGKGLFQYNAPMNAFFCPHYHWGSEESFIQGKCCDSIVTVADMMEDPDGGPVRHRHNMEKVTPEEYREVFLEQRQQEKFKLTKRKEPTPPPGMGRMENYGGYDN